MLNSNIKNFKVSAFLNLNSNFLWFYKYFGEKFNKRLKHGKIFKLVKNIIRNNALLFKRASTGTKKILDRKKIEINNRDDKIIFWASKWKFYLIKYGIYFRYLI